MHLLWKPWTNMLAFSGHLATAIAKRWQIYSITTGPATGRTCTVGYTENGNQGQRIQCFSYLMYGFLKDGTLVRLDRQGVHVRKADRDQLSQLFYENVFLLSTTFFIKALISVNKQNRKHRNVSDTKFVIMPAYKNTLVQNDAPRYHIIHIRSTNISCSEVFYSVHLSCSATKIWFFRLKQVFVDDRAVTRSAITQILINMKSFFPHSLKRTITFIIHVQRTASLYSRCSFFFILHASFFSIDLVFPLQVLSFTLICVRTCMKILFHALVNPRSSSHRICMGKHYTCSVLPHSLS